MTSLLYYIKSMYLICLTFYRTAKQFNTEGQKVRLKDPFNV